MSSESLAWCDVDLEQSGKHAGHVFIPHSVTRSAYGNVAIPLVVLKNGEGPTVLLTAGNHGDEFEGQIVAGRLAHRLQAADIHGRLIIVPGLNFPAAAAGLRVSPLDGGNLNRSFPGDPRGTITEQIAYYVHSALMPEADVVIDLHSGGSSLDYLSTAFTNISGDRELDHAALKAMQVFGAPLTMVYEEQDDPRRAFSSAHRNGCIYLSTELGGAGSVNVDNLALSWAGTVRLLLHFGLLKQSASLEPIRAAVRTRFVQVPDRSHQLHASTGGIFEPRFKLGDEVRSGQLAGLTYSQLEPTREPVPSHFKADGFVICRRHPALVEAGDCLAHTAVDFDVRRL